MQAAGRRRRPTIVLDEHPAVGEGFPVHATVLTTGEGGYVLMGEDALDGTELQRYYNKTNHKSLHVSLHMRME
jgi:hypothetical protein